MAVGKYLPEANPGPAEDVAVTLRNLLEGLGGGSQLSHDSLDDVSPSDHHTKYTDSDAIGAIEGEATLDLTGDLSTPGSLTSTGGGQTGKFLTGQAGNTVFAFSGDNFDIRAGTGGSSSQNVMRVTSAGDIGIGTLNTHTVPGGTDTFAMLAATQELDNKTLDSSVLKGTFTASGTVVLPAFTLGGTMDANSQALINVSDLDLGTESAWGTFSAMLTAANAGTAWLIKSKDTSDILRPRLGLSGGVDIAVWGWEYSTHTGIVLSGALDANSNDINNVAAPNAAGDPLIKGTRHLIAEMPTLTTGKIWKGVAGVPTEADAPTPVYAELTVTGFQFNNATGTVANPDRSNDGNIANFALAISQGQYAEVTLPSVTHITQFRYYGQLFQNLDGFWKVQYKDVNDQWIDWITGIATREASWTNWDSSGGQVIAKALKMIATTLDSRGGGESNLGEWEVKY